MTESIVPPESEHLTDGWEPETPFDDTLKRRAVHVLGSWPVAVTRALGRPYRSTDRWAGGWIGDRGALTNPVVLLRPLDAAEAPDVLREVDETIPAQTPYFLLNPWPAPDLGSRGLGLVGHPPLMVRLPEPRQVPAPPGVEVREVADAETLAVAERVLVEGYPMPDLQPLRRGELLGPKLLGSSTRVWLGLVDGRPASVAAAHQHAGATLVEYVAALPTARGRGAGSAVTWAATLADPESPAVLVASDDGRPVYEAMGYVALERWTCWLRS